jgi:hyperosmotically inducible periplasmic protein
VEVAYQLCCHVGDCTKNMKRTTLSLLCLSTVALSAFSQENASSAADNSGRNIRDRSGNTQTSGDQSNATPDIKTSAAIRRSLMHDHSLSMMAKNVKIDTENGVVTLRGPVKSDAEKTKIEELAKQAAQGATIHNQLEVQASD